MKSPVTLICTHKADALFGAKLSQQSRLRAVMILVLLATILLVCGRGEAAFQVSVVTIGRVSMNSAGSEANGFSAQSSISADGRFVAFRSAATNLVAGDTNSNSDIFVHDRQTGATTRVSVDSAGGQVNGWSGWPSISADGRFVAYTSDASNLVIGDSNSKSDIFVHDRQTGATTRVSVDSEGGQADESSFFPRRFRTIASRRCSAKAAWERCIAPPTANWAGTWP